MSTFAQCQPSVAVKPCVLVIILLGLLQSVIYYKSSNYLLFGETPTIGIYDIIGENVTIINYDKHCLDNHTTGVISGLYNTGTNVLFFALNNNCDQRVILWQPQWGKHELITKDILMEFENDYKNNLILVMIKDPLTWIKSMCKANYDFKLINKNSKWFKKQCPSNIKYSKINWIPANRGVVLNVNRTSNGIFDSIIHIWNAYYEHYLNQDIYHYLIIRFEDLLFRQKFMDTQLCHCIGNHKLKHNSISMIEKPAKPHGKPRGRYDAMKIYSNPKYRYDGFTDEDLIYLNQHINHTIVHMFGYQFDLNRTMKIR